MMELRLLISLSQLWSFIMILGKELVRRWLLRERDQVLSICCTLLLKNVESSVMIGFRHLGDGDVVQLLGYLRLQEFLENL